MVVPIRSNNSRLAAAGRKSYCTRSVKLQDLFVYFKFEAIYLHAYATGAENKNSAGVRVLTRKRVGGINSVCK